MSRADRGVVARVVERHLDVVREAALRHEHDIALLLALVCQESAGDPTARRPEPGFLRMYRSGIVRTVRAAGVEHYAAWLASDPLWFATSIGLLQVLNVVAIERGVVLPTQDAQTAPAVSLEAGCRHLTFLRRRIHRREPNPETRLLLKWNGGANRLYPGEVLAWRSVVREVLG